MTEAQRVGSVDQLGGGGRRGQRPVVALVDAGELEPGTAVLQTRGYRIGARLGEGGMGVVYRAYDPAMGREVAIKVLKPDVSAACRRRFEREAQIGSQFSHANLVRVLDMGRLPNSDPWIALEYLQGQDLATVIDEGGRLGVRVLVDVFTQTLDALQYIHARHIVHRDVKPANMLLARDPHNERIVVVKLIDFGICLDQRDVVHDEEPNAGDPRYMAPEQAEAVDALTPAADLYALGVSLYEAATGYHPFSLVLGECGAGLMDGELEDDCPPPPSQLLPGGLPAEFGAALDAIVDKACAADPAERFVNAAQMKSAVAQLLAASAV